MQQWDHQTCCCEECWAHTAHASTPRSPTSLRLANQLTFFPPPISFSSSVVSLSLCTVNYSRMFFHLLLLRSYIQHCIHKAWWEVKNKLAIDCLSINSLHIAPYISDLRSTTLHFGVSLHTLPKKLPSLSTSSIFLCPRER
jgi:hypothetical protein